MAQSNFPLTQGSKFLAASGTGDFQRLPPNSQMRTLTDLHYSKVDGISQTASWLSANGFHELADKLTNLSPIQTELVDQLTKNMWLGVFHPDLYDKTPGASGDWGESLDHSIVGQGFLRLNPVRPKNPQDDLFSFFHELMHVNRIIDGQQFDTVFHPKKSALSFMDLARDRIVKQESLLYEFSEQERISESFADIGATFLSSTNANTRSLVSQITQKNRAVGVNEWHDYNHQSSGALKYLDSSGFWNTTMPGEKKEFLKTISKALETSWIPGVKELPQTRLSSGDADPIPALGNLCFEKIRTGAIQTTRGMEECQANEVGRAWTPPK